MQVLRRPIAILRILFGVLFVVKSAMKFANEDYLYGGLMDSIERAGRAFPFYEGVLSNYVDTHQGFFTYAIPFGELLVGLSLVFGAFVSLSAAAGAFMIVNYTLATDYGSSQRLVEHLAMVVLLVTLGCMGAGLTWGLDRWLVRRSGSALVLLPLRRSVPNFQKSS
jgi:thiosulfate dehydrogenase (quinone) large subunit